MRISVENIANVSGLLHMAVEVGFDWVQYTHSDFIRLSAIPDGGWINQFINCVSAL